MQIGKLNRRITIQENTPEQNDIGEWVDSWSDWATVWAAIEPASGKLFYESKQLDSKVDGRIRIRYIEGLEPTMQIVFEGRILNIVALLNVKENRREIHIMYSEALD